MDSTVGMVIPAFHPDRSLLNRYIDSLNELGIERIHIELDDPTKPTLNGLTNQDSLNVASHRRGKGKAITDGFNELSSDVDVLAFADADGSVNSSSAERVLRPVRDGTADLAVGSRRHPDARIRSHQTNLRRWMGDVFAWSTRQLLPVELYDYQCGMKALSATAWNDLSDGLTETGFAWDIELLAMAERTGYSITEVPVTWDDSPGTTVDPIAATLEMGTALLSIKRRLRESSRETAIERNRLDTDEGRSIAPGDEW